MLFCIRSSSQVLDSPGGFQVAGAVVLFRLFVRAATAVATPVRRSSHGRGRSCGVGLVLAGLDAELLGLLLQLVDAAGDLAPLGAGEAAGGQLASGGLQLVADALLRR